MYRSCKSLIDMHSTPRDLADISAYQIRLLLVRYGFAHGNGFTTCAS